MNLSNIMEIVKENLSEKRFNHSYNVMLKCEELALTYGVDVDKAKLIGIAHDIAKELSTEEMFSYIKENNILIDRIEQKCTWLLHGKIGAVMCKNKFAYDDDMARAIEIHTTGDINMTLFDKILFVADYISDDDDFSVDNFKGLDSLVLEILNLKIKKNLKKGTIIHIRSIEARNNIIENILNN